MAIRADADFRAKVREKLGSLEMQLISALRRQIEAEYPTEAHALSFVVFSDGFTAGFPARAYVLNRANSQVCVSSADLLQADETYPEQLERDAEAADPDMDVWGAAAEVFIEWFAECWGRAGGAGFALPATLAEHDTGRLFDLTTMRWISLD
ncbi:hypothetical protein [Geopseudomonas aromaticivorans]